MSKKNTNKVSSQLHLEFKNDRQSEAWDSFQKNDVIFMSGPAGSGKTYLAMSFALSQLFAGKQNKIILTRPIVESGESLGYLPGEFEEKVAPYMLPLYDNMSKMLNYNVNAIEGIKKNIEVAPIAYMRGRNFSNCVCIFDEAQNATLSQLKLFLSRFSDNSKVIVTGDPDQSDIVNSGLCECILRLSDIEEIGFIKFYNEHIVRHPLVGKIIDKLS